MEMRDARAGPRGRAPSRPVSFELDASPPSRRLHDKAKRSSHTITLHSACAGRGP